MARRRRVRKLSRATRAKISRALKAYYRNQRRIASVRLVNLEKARAAKRRLERQRRRLARLPKEPRGVTTISPQAPIGRYAFKALDQQPDILDVRAGKRPGEDVTANLTYQYTDPRTGETYDLHRTITFDAGEDDEEFEDNYYDALREDVEEVSADAEGETGGRYERFAVLVTRLA